MGIVALRRAIVIEVPRSRSLETKVNGCKVKCKKKKAGFLCASLIKHHAMKKYMGVEV
jgi:L-asparaginase II